ncbi:hypothetical protein CLU79DRAFT_336042 [Phycomyces nitens]|nr:hypothetical protein CLU79DRAFT_336042 [Phycomyces nitens]
MSRRTILSDYNNQEMMRDLIDDINDYIGDPEKPNTKTNESNPSLPETLEKQVMNSHCKETLMSDIAKSLDPMDSERPLLVESDTEDEEEEAQDEEYDDIRNNHEQQQQQEEEEEDDDDEEEEERYAHRRFPSRLSPSAVSTVARDSVERSSVKICHKCKKEEPVKPKPSNTLRPEYTCKDCKKGSRRRSLSATGMRILEFAGRVKQTLLAPIKTIERRRSMPSIEVYTKDGKDLLHKNTPSPATSTGNHTIPIVDRQSIISPRYGDRPGTFYSVPERATSYRKPEEKETDQEWTSRNQRSLGNLKYNLEPQTIQNRQHEKWPSTAIETKDRIFASPEYPRESVHQDNQKEEEEEEEEYEEEYHQYQYQEQEQEQEHLNQYSPEEYYNDQGDYEDVDQDQGYIMMGTPSEMVYSTSPSHQWSCLTPANRNGEEHIPLRTMDLDGLNTHRDRMIAYEHAYYNCIAAKTYLTPWVKKQYSKGPPDAMFDYTPPPKRSTSRIFGLFKRSSSRNLSQTSMVDLANPLTKSVLSLSSHISSSQTPISTIATNQTGHLIQDQRLASNLDFHSGDNDEEDNSLQIVNPKKSRSSLQISPSSSFRESHYSPTSISSVSPVEEPVSILKKKPSKNKIYKTPSPRHSVFLDQSEEDYDEDVPLDNHHNHQDFYEPHIPVQRRSSYAPMTPSYHKQIPDSRNRVIDLDNFQEPYSAPKRRVKSTPPAKQYNSRPLSYTESAPLPVPTRSSKYVGTSPNSSLYREYQTSQAWPQAHSSPAQNTFDYDYTPGYSDQRSYPYQNYRPAPEPSYESQRYHHTPAARAAQEAQFSYDAWDKALDDLCAFFRHVDRSILEEYLEEAQGDFYVAKKMCIDTIMTSGL